MRTARAHVKAANQQTGGATTERARTLIGMILCLVIGAWAVGGMGGCYRRVVGAKGIGADQYEISEPYQKDTRVDRWFYGSDSRQGGSKLP